MAKFILEFEDTEDGGMKAKVELKGFSDASKSNMGNQTCV